MAVDEGAAGAGEGDVPATKRRAYDNVSGRKSGRPWKVQFGRASSLGARPPGDWDAKMREKAAKKETQARRDAWNTRSRRPFWAHTGSSTLSLQLLRLTGLLPCRSGWRR
jgi:hypothetical protein